jgi:adenine-specific DNA-methyltransferase
MTENQKKLINLLKEMFRFDQADLDFGIYRIMRMKREEISRFIEEDLPAQITEGLQELVSVSTDADIAEIDKQIANAKSLNISETATDISSVEADVYNHLTNFLSRYYDEGDFISQCRYKDGAYVIPYEGEEVKLYWANADQYYIKTSEYFKDYTFKTAYGDTVRFKLVEADTERDNNKAGVIEFG